MNKLILLFAKLSETTSDTHDTIRRTESPPPAYESDFNNITPTATTTTTTSTATGFASTTSR